MPRLFILLLLWATLAASGNKLAQADDLTILNSGFEEPALPDGVWAPAPAEGWFPEDIEGWELGFYDLFDPGEWFPEDDLPDQEQVGVWNPDAADGFTGGEAFAGENNGWAISENEIEWGLTQILTDTLQANTQYVLGVQVGNALYNQSNVTADYRIELLAGTVLLAEDSGASPRADSWEFHSLTYSSGPDPAQLGKPLEIRLTAVDYVDEGGSGGYEVEYDEVTLTAEAINLLTGDYDNSGELDEPDLNLQAVQISNPPGDPTYDLDENGVVDFEDRKIWVRDLKKTWIGDANLDLEFNSSDMVQVFSKGKYEKDEQATWGEGDWTGDQLFGSGDMVAAFVDGGYEQGQMQPAAAVSAVPEPSGIALAILGLLGLLGLTCRRGD